MSDRKNNKNNNPNLVRLLAFGFVLLVAAPTVMIPIAIIGSIIYVVVKAKAAQKSGTSTQHSHSQQSYTQQSYTQRSYTQSAQQPDSQRSRQNTARNTAAFDDCPSSPLFCFHKDKGEHHLRKGKEIDPWDRPDIDISKYQRRG